jgi:hypothetical protein
MAVGCCRDGAEMEADPRVFAVAGPALDEPHDEEARLMKTRTLAIALSGCRNCTGNS